MLNKLQQEIMRLKRERDIYILAHSYQRGEIIDIADFIGDSFALSVKAAQVQSKTVIMCGVRFMAQTVKLLSPDKTVYLANADAGCPMAEQFTVEQVSEMKRLHPDCTVVAYINTTAELKTICDVCVTSSSAVKIVEKIDNRDILFIPDCNLGGYVADRVKDKNIILMPGGCPIHAAVTVEDVRLCKAEHPSALLLVHPECPRAVANEADFIGSTAAIMQFAENSRHDEFIIGTELEIARHLQRALPNKRFYDLTDKLICPDMKLIELSDVLDCINGRGEVITMDEYTMKNARKCIDKMLELG